MKRFISIISLCLCCAAASAQSNNPRYDKALADSLGADEYGMKPYVLVMLKTGPQKTDDKAMRDSLFRGHMTNINRLVEEGKLIVAGPLKKNERSYRGIFIFNVKTLEEANALLRTDPAVAYGLLDAELFEWYGPAALPVYLEVNKRIEKMQP